MSNRHLPIGRGVCSPVVPETTNPMHCRREGEAIVNSETRLRIQRLHCARCLRLRHLALARVDRPVMDPRPDRAGLGW